MDKIDDTLSNAVNHNSPVTKNCSSNLKSFSWLIEQVGYSYPY